jgi:hypothetical protein
VPKCAQRGINDLDTSGVEPEDTTPATVASKATTGTMLTHAAIVSRKLLLGRLLVARRRELMPPPGEHVD